MITIKRTKPTMCGGCLCDDTTETRWYDVAFRNVVITLCEDCLDELKQKIEEL